MEKARDTVFTVAAIGALVMVMTMGAFYSLSLAFPKLFYLGTVQERMAYLISHSGLRALAWFLAFGWTTGEIPVGLALFYLVRERNPEAAYLGAPFWYMGIAVQYIAYMLMFSIIRGVTTGLLSAGTFAFLDGLGFAFQAIGVMLLSVGMLLFAFAFMKDRGMIRIVGWIFLVNALSVLGGGLITIFTGQGFFPPLFRFGMILYAGLGAFLPIISFALLVPIFLKTR